MDDVIAVLTFFFGVIALLAWLYVARLAAGAAAFRLLQFVTCGSGLSNEATIIMMYERTAA